MQEKIAKGLFWRSLEGLGVQGMQFFIQLFLARILMPEDFGVIAILNIFINLANTFVQNGLGAAILQKKNPEQVDYCTVFYVECGIAVLMYIIIFVTAPLIATFYDNEYITTYLRIFSLTIIFCALGSMQTTVLRRRLDFKSSFIANFVGIICQGFCGIGAALCGWGIWSIIISQIIYRIVTSFLLFIFARWIPALMFSFRHLVTLFSFSWKLFVGWLIGTLYNDLFALIIGKQYSERILGYYAKGQNLPYTLNRVIIQVTSAVMFPAIAKDQDDLSKVKNQTRNMITMSVALVFPMMSLLAVTSPSLIPVVLTDKWLGAVPIVQIFCIPAALNVVSNANMQTFNALGRSDVFLRLETIKRSLTILLVLVFSTIDFYLMLISIAFMSVVDLILNGYFNNKLIKYSIKEQLTDIIPGLCLAVGFFVVLSSFNYFFDNPYFILGIQLLIAACFYSYLVCFSKIGSFVKVRFALQSFLIRYGRKKQ